MMGLECLNEVSWSASRKRVYINKGSHFAYIHTDREILRTHLVSLFKLLNFANFCTFK